MTILAFILDRRPRCQYRVPIPRSIRIAMILSHGRTRPRARKASSISTIDAGGEDVNGEKGDVRDGV